MTRIYAVLAFLGLLPQPVPVYVRAMPGNPVSKPEWRSGYSGEAE